MTETEEEWAVDNPEGGGGGTSSRNKPTKRTGTVLDYFEPGPGPSSEQDKDSAQQEEEASGPSTTSFNFDEEMANLTEEEREMLHSPGSLVWYYFEKSPSEDKATCKVCGQSRSTPTGTTSTLRNHLNSPRHLKQYKQFCKLEKLRKKINDDKDKKKQSSSNEKSQPTLLELKGSFGTLPPNSKRAKELTRCIAIFLVKGLHPWSTVNEPGFKYLMWKVEPRYVVPHRTTFSRFIFPKLYEEVKKAQQAYFRRVVDSDTLESITIMCDMWTSRAHDAFIAFDVQFTEAMEKEFVLKNLTVECKPFPGSHSGERICEEAYDMIKQIGVDPDIVRVYIVTDNGSNMVAGLEQPALSRLNARGVPDILRDEKPWTHLRCFDHTLQLAIGDAREEVGTHTVIEKVAAIVKRYSYSTVARNNLERHQQETNTVQHEIIRHVCTRWNSEFAMLDRFLEQRVPITLELNEAGEDSLTAQQWKMCEGYVEILRPIALFTADMGSVSTSTFSMIIPVLNEIKNSLNEFLKKPSNKGAGITFARALLNSIVERFPDSLYANSTLHQVATALDPRFKGLLFPENFDVAGLLLEEAKRKYREHVRRGKISLPTTATASTENNRAPTPAKKSKWAFLKKVSAKHAEGPEELDILLQKEVQTYLDLETIDVDDDPFLWWKTNREAFPHLIPLAAEYLAIGATEVQSERDFSIGSNTVTPKRTCLLQDHVKQTVFLHRNLEIPKIPASKSQK